MSFSRVDRWCWMRWSPPGLFPQMPQMLSLGPCPPSPGHPDGLDPKIYRQAQGFWSISNWGGASRAPRDISNGGPRACPLKAVPQTLGEERPRVDSQGDAQGFFSSVRRNFCTFLEFGTFSFKLGALGFELRILGFIPWALGFIPGTLRFISRAPGFTLSSLGIPWGSGVLEWVHPGL